MEDSDVELVLEFLAVLKHRPKLSRKKFNMLLGALEVLQEEMVKVEGEENLIGPSQVEARIKHEELN